MITNTEIQTLRGLTDREPLAVKLGEKILVHAKWFVIEFPPTHVGTDVTLLEELDDTPYAELPEWRAKVPTTEAEYAAGVRFTHPTEGISLIKLVSDNTTAIIHPSIYEVVMKHVAEPEFRVYNNEPLYVSIWSNGEIVGLTAQVKL